MRNLVKRIIASNIAITLLILVTACNENDIIPQSETELTGSKSILESTPDTITPNLPIEKEHSVINEHGNTHGNIVNHGYVAIQGNWIYYNSDRINGSLHRININGSGKQKLNDNDSWYINVVDDWVYYLYNGMYLCKIRTDGSDIQKINDDDSWFINIVGNMIFYSNGSDNHKLYQIKTDGSERKIVD